jgi:hypothetical protein
MQAAFPPGQKSCQTRGGRACLSFSFEEIAMASVPQPRRSAGEYSGFDRQPSAGSWRGGRGKGRLAGRNPYTGETLLEIAHADARDLGEAYAGAVKAQKAWAARLPGEKNSGIGRFGGDWAVDAFTTDKWVTVQHVPRQFPANANVLKGPWAGG